MHTDLRVYDIERMWMFREALNLAEALAPVTSVFDCACNTGFWLAQARRHLPDAQLVGVDNDGSSIKLAQTTHPGIEFIQGDSRTVLLKSDWQFDLILCMGLLYYYHDFERFLDILTQHCRIGMLVDTVVLRPDGQTDSGAPPPVATLTNAPNEMTRAAAETRGEVRIPQRAALERHLWSRGFHTRRIDVYSGRYEESVANRLAAPLECIGLLCIRHRNPFSEDGSWSGWGTTTVAHQRVCTAYQAE